MPTKASGRSLREGKLPGLKSSLGLQYIRRHLAKSSARGLGLGAIALGERRAVKKRSPEQRHCGDRPEHDVHWNQRQRMVGIDLLGWRSNSSILILRYHKES